MLERLIIFIDFIVGKGVPAVQWQPVAITPLPRQLRISDLRGSGRYKTVELQRAIDLGG